MTGPLQGAGPSSLVPVDQRPQGADLVAQRLAPPCGDTDPGLRPPADIPLLHPDVLGLLEHADVPGEVAGLEYQRVAQVAELAVDRSAPAHRGQAPTEVSTQIVGSSWTETGNHAFVITQGQIVDLNDAIVASSPDKLFVTLDNAQDINENGWIAANGIDSRTGMQGAYLLRPVAGP